LWCSNEVARKRKCQLININILWKTHNFAQSTTPYSLQICLAPTNKVCFWSIEEVSKQGQIPKMTPLKIFKFGCWWTWIRFRKISAENDRKTGGPSTGINHNQESQPCLESYVKLAIKNNLIQKEKYITIQNLINWLFW